MSLKEKILRIIPDIPADSGTHAHADNTTEQTAITLTITSRTKINNIILNFTNITKNTTVRTKVGGETVDTLNWNTSMDVMVYLGTITSNDDVTVTIQSTPTQEGAIKDIDWDVL